MARKNISIDELKAIQVEILQSVHDFCIANNLKYSLSFGSLLGAIRHKGFIPWDDDIDIMMPRKDYEALISKFNHPYYKLYDHRTTAEYAKPYAKLADSRTMLIENSDALNMGISIDIFPVDDLFDTQEECLALIRQIAPWKTRYRMKLLKPGKKNVWWKRIAIRLSKLLVMGQSLKQLANKQYELAIQPKNQQSEYVGILLSNDRGAAAERLFFHRSMFENYQALPFEDRKFMCINDYDTHLKQVYGDYMTPPPNKERTSPHTLCDIYWI